MRKGICEVCGKRRVVHKNPKSGRLICANCYLRRRGTCSVCGKDRIVHKKRNSKKRICSNCYQKLYYSSYNFVLERCAKCKKKRPVVARTDAGRPICFKCCRRRGRLVRAKLQAILLGCIRLVRELDRWSESD